MSNKLMVLVHIAHYLKPENYDKFRQWFQETVNTLKGVNGFIRLIYAGCDSESGHNLFLFFTSEKLLEDWTQSARHKKLVSALDPWRSRPYHAKRYRILADTSS
ncbi:MAG: antibiotic biosynthesis monooxygenase family protein [Nitrospinota bacterium]